ncbi:sigma-70 family RNA polymerase sigma factor [Paraglaciecola aquimarina]|uniref:Sigma-70 family RNA polymerase sigma factor n=1 Tax=Paraglaciecola aquimarina TaxID=1235557 RepID=A0ABU3SS24_9ALTE|nr:sigma-70 family RNA polymerase sigma factor [Paraglaciecola aquimarina]MDU0352777.1 sigma-70 family RNA polymerase sigma factor [Paraglaciecola aquimarina]
MLIKELDTYSSKATSIVARISSGDKHAEQELVETYYRGLFFILNKQTQNSALSEDLAQDTFIIVIQKARENGIHNPAALSAFIRQTGINLLIGHKRKESRRDTQSTDNIEFHAPSQDIEICKALHSKKLLQLTQQLLNELNVDRDKQLLRSYFIYDKNKQQICQDLELSPEYFDKVLFRARQRIKQLIQHKIGANAEASTILSTSLLFCLVVQQTTIPPDKNLFIHLVRETANHQHLPFETPLINSRYIPVLSKTSMPLTSKKSSV